MINNKTFLDSHSAIELIQSEMKNKLPNFKQKSIQNNGDYGGFKVDYQLNNVILQIGGERGGLDYLITIDGLRHTLLDFNPATKEIYSASKENFEFIIQIIRDYLLYKELI